MFFGILSNYVNVISFSLLKSVFALADTGIRLCSELYFFFSLCGQISQQKDILKFLPQGINKNKLWASLGIPVVGGIFSD